MLRNDKDCKDKEKDDKKNDNKSEAEVLAAKQRETLPIEERIQMFKSMLLEKEVEFYYYLNGIIMKTFLTNLIIIFRYQHFPPGRKNYTRLSSINGIYCLLQKNENKYLNSLLKNEPRKKERKNVKDRNCIEINFDNY